MKKVLVIAYYFPPLGGSGVQRPLKFVKYLREFGWDPVVLTVRDSNYIIDQSLFKDIPPSTEIIRVKYFNLIRLLYGFRKLKLEFIGKFILKYMIPIDPHILWALVGFKKIKKYLKNNPVDAVYVTGAPFSSFLIAYWIKKRFHIPYMLDYRDDWIENPFYKLPFVRKYFEKFLERMIARSASYAITVSTPIKQILQQRNSKLNIEVITNGYDSQEIQLLSTKKNKLFKTVYAGSFYQKRSPESLFRALSELISEGKIKKTKFLFDIYGRSMDENIVEMIKNFNLESTVSFNRSIPHHSLLNRLSNYDAYIIIIGAYKNSNGVLSGKLFEYMGFGKPILALIPEGEAKLLLTQSRLGFFAHPENIEDIKNQFLHLYNKFHSDSLKVNPNWKVVRQYDRKNLTKKLVDILEFVKKQNGC